MVRGTWKNLELVGRGSDFFQAPDIFFEKPFPECDVIKGGGGVGENKDMKHVKTCQKGPNFCSSRGDRRPPKRFVFFSSIYTFFTDTQYIVQAT